MATPEKYFEYLKRNGREASFKKIVAPILEADGIKGKDHLIRVDNFYPEDPRIVLLDNYQLATGVSLHGCGCCYYPDYIIHFTTGIETPSGIKTVYLRSEDWGKYGTPDERYRHALALLGRSTFPDYEASRARLPHLLEFYKQKGVKEPLLTKTKEEIEFYLVDEESDEPFDPRDYLYRNDLPPIADE